MPIVVNISATRTLGQLKSRVADELARSDLASQIALAIEDAISEAATNRFWFNEVAGLQFGVSAGQSVYASDEIGAITQIDALWLTVNGQRRDLRLARHDELNRLAQGTPTTGEPYLYSRYGGAIRLDPVPQQSYTATLDGVSRLTSLVDDNDYNGWTDINAGERYVRALAKRNMLLEVIQDGERGEYQAKLAERYKQDLIAQTYDRIATGTMACHG